MYSISEITTEEKFSALHDEWNALLDQSECDSIFLTWEWMYSWWQYFNKNQQLYIIEVRDELQNLVGIGPFFIKKYKLLNLKCLSVLASDSLVASDILDLIVASDNCDEIRYQILSALFKPSRLWDIIVLSHIIESSPTLQFAVNLAREKKFCWIKKENPICLYIELPEEYHDFINNLSPRTRRNIRNSQRRLIDEYQVMFEKITSPQQIEKAMQIMTMLHLTRRDSLSQFTPFKDKFFFNFQLITANRLSINSWIEFDLMKQGQNYIAVFYFLKYKNQLFLYQGGFDNSHLPKNISLMSVLLNQCIHKAIYSGITKIHFLEGITQFKSSFTNKSINTQKIIIGNGYKFYAYTSYLYIKKNVKDIFKRLLPETCWNYIKDLFKRVT